MAPGYTQIVSKRRKEKRLGTGFENRPGEGAEKARNQGRPCFEIRPDTADKRQNESQALSKNWNMMRGAIFMVGIINKKPWSFHLSHEIVICEMQIGQSKKKKATNFVMEAKNTNKSLKTLTLSTAMSSKILEIH